MDDTKVFRVEELENYRITEILKFVNDALNERGYDGINQIVGYLMSGDLAYISSYKSARSKIQKLEREKILEALLRYYLKDSEE